MNMLYFWFYAKKKLIIWTYEYVRYKQVEINTIFEGKIVNIF